MVATAGEVFAQKGYAATTLEDLVSATGLGKQSLYNAFGAKRDLFLRALTSETADAVAAVEEAFAEGDSTPLERIKAHLLKLAITLSGPERRRSLVAKATIELADGDAEVAGSALRAFTDLAGIYRGCIVEAQRSGEVDSAADPEALADFFVALTRGMEMLGQAGIGREQLTGIAMTSLDVLPRVHPADPR
ncbi:TetR family transcriptional regulator [Actinoplanes sp. L3-i22]|nr:TetR family transcriptional regulator [Actinoplanes sp. L3-i22]